MSSFLQRWAEEPDQDPLGLIGIEHASALLNRLGARLMRLNGGYAIGLWRERDGQQVRSALRTLEMDELPVRYLEEDGIPELYKTQKE